MKIIVNRKAQLEAVKFAVDSCTRQIQAGANRGQEKFSVEFTLPNFNSDVVLMELKKIGVECVERGFHSRQLENGDYKFEVKLKISFQLTCC